MRANLHQSIRNRQGIVENTGVGEVAHAETVQPFHRAGITLAIFFVLDAYLAGEHCID